MTISTLPPPPDNLVTCPACAHCRVCHGARWLTYEAREEWFNRNPEVWASLKAVTLPPPPMPRMCPLPPDDAPVEESGLRAKAVRKAV